MEFGGPKLTKNWSPLENAREGALSQVPKIPSGLMMCQEYSQNAAYGYTQTYCSHTKRLQNTTGKGKGT